MEAPHFFFSSSQLCFLTKRGTNPASLEDYPSATAASKDLIMLTCKTKGRAMKINQIFIYSSTVPVWDVCLIPGVKCPQLRADFFLLARLLNQSEVVHGH